MLDAAGRLPRSAEMLRRDAQILVARAIWDPALARAICAAGEKRAEWGEQAMHDRINQFERLLRQENVSPAFVPLGRLHLALYQYQRQRMQATRETLDQLSATIGDADVWQGFQGMYWNLRGLVETEQSSYATAFACHAKALDLRREAALPHDQAESLSNLGMLLLRVGDYPQAQTLFNQANAIYELPEAAGDSTRLVKQAYARLNGGKAIEGARDFDRAAAIFEQLLLDVDSAAGQDYLRCLCHNNLAMVYYNQGEFDKSEKQWEQCRNIAATAFGPSHLHVAEIDVNLGWLAFATDRFDLAESRFQRALDVLLENYREHPRAAETMGYLARTAAARGQVGAARRLLDCALAKRERYLHQTFASALSERDRLAVVQELRVHPESMAWPGSFDTYLELAPRLGIPAGEQYRRVLTWKGIFSRHALPVQDDLHSDEGRELAAQRTEVRRELRGLAVGDRSRPEGTAAQIAELERNANDIERRLRRLRGQQPSPTADIDVDQVVAAIGPGAAMVDAVEVRCYLPRGPGERVLDSRRYVVFLLKPDGSVARIDLGDAFEIDSAIKQLGSRLAAGGAFTAPARQVAELTTAKLWDRLNDVKLLILVGDGSLHRLRHHQRGRANRVGNRARIDSRGAELGRRLCLAALCGQRQAKHAAGAAVVRPRTQKIAKRLFSTRRIACPQLGNRQCKSNFSRSIWACLYAH